MRPSSVISSLHHRTRRRTHLQRSVLHHQTTERRFLGWSVQTGREKRVSLCIECVGYDIVWGLCIYSALEITCVFVFALAIKSTFIPPTTTCKHKQSSVIIKSHTLAGFGKCLCLHTTLASVFDDCFPEWFWFFSRACWERAHATWLPTLALLWIRAMSLKWSVQDCDVVTAFQQ